MFAWCSASIRLKIIQGSAGALDLLQNIRCFGGSYEGLGLLIVPLDVELDFVDQLLHIVKDATADAVLGQVAEEALDHVQPGTTVWGEVDTEPSMTFEPALHLGVFVCGVVVDDQVDLPIVGCGEIDRIQEPEPFLMSVPVVAHREDRSVQDIQCRKQR